MSRRLLVEWDTQPWAMVPERLEKLFSIVAGVPEAPMALSAAAAPAYSITSDGMAVIPISGVLLKKVPAWVRYLGIEATGYDEIRTLIDRAVVDRGVSKIELRISSPGGQVSGVLETAVAISVAGSSKPVIATIEDLGASAAYWLASRAAVISAGPMSEVGSIGVYAVMTDYSGMAEQLGIKVHVIRSGELKGAGVPGAPITDGQLGAMQSIIDGMASQFIASVASGRKMAVDKIKALATGRTWLAGEASELGLIDHVLGEGGPADAHRAHTERHSMPQEVITSSAVASTEQSGAGPASASAPQIDAEQVRSDERARLGRLKAAFPNDLAFAIDQFEVGRDVQDAKAAYCDVLMARAKTVTLADPTPAAKPASQPVFAGAPAVPFVEAGGSGGSQPGFMDRAKEMAADRKCTITEAVKVLSKQDPTSYQAFLAKERERPLTVHSSAKVSRVARG